MNRHTREQVRATVTSYRLESADSVVVVVVAAAWAALATSSWSWTASVLRRSWAVRDVSKRKVELVVVREGGEGGVLSPIFVASFLTNSSKIAIAAGPSALREYLNHSAPNVLALSRFPPDDDDDGDDDDDDDDDDENL